MKKNNDCIDETKQISSDKMSIDELTALVKESDSNNERHCLKVFQVLRKNQVPCSYHGMQFGDSSKRQEFFQCTPWQGRWVDESNLNSAFITVRVIAGDNPIVGYYMDPAMALDCIADGHDGIKAVTVKSNLILVVETGCGLKFEIEQTAMNYHQDNIFVL